MIAKHTPPPTLTRAFRALACLLLFCGASIAHQQSSAPSAKPTGSPAQSGAAPSASVAVPAAVKSVDAAKPANSGQALADTAGESLAPVVYKDDQMPGARGYQYTFFGNAFFINEQGYLLTVAHVMETFAEGGQPPYILVSRVNAPPGLLQVTVVARDPEHDVAVLRVTPNPFTSPGLYSVAFVPLSSDQPARGESVLALSLHPKQAAFAQTYDLPRQDSSPGTVMSFEQTQLDKSGAPAQVFLLSHAVVKGQSGSPVMDVQTGTAIGLVEGIWLRGTTGSVAHASSKTAGAPGAAIPIQYALTLLKENGVTWHTTAPGATAATNSSLKR
jgi:serine protease Do